MIHAGILSDESREKFQAAVKKTKIRGLIEFSRAIHAEMHAILSAARSEGDRIHGGTLVVTTYPCHSCARHIVAAGIKEVFYIEPYRKSMAIALHEDAITEDEKSIDKVRILPYHGVAPRRYFSLFLAGAERRKSPSNGRRLEIDKKFAWPVTEKSTESFPTLESLVVRNITVEK